MKRNSRTKRHIALSICAGVAVALLAACGGGGGGGSNQAAAGDGAAAPAPTARAVPTMPQAQFAAPTSMIRSGSEDPVTDTETMTETATMTDTESIATPEPEAEADTAADIDLERGATIYANRNCAECHGAEGEGVADQGSAIAGTTLTEAEFNDLMRTGGEIGPDHLYGPNAISPGGMTALHAWLQSLAE